MAKLPEGVRIAVLVRDEGRCVYCGATYQKGARLSVDHVRSRKSAGSDAFSNLVAACMPCNEDKAHFSLKAYLTELKERGQDITGIAERVAAACAKPIDWLAVERAREVIKQQALAEEEEEP